MGLAGALLLGLGAAGSAWAQGTQATAPPSQSGSQAGTAKPGGPPAVPAGVPVPPGYVIGADDVLSVLFWRDQDMSADVVVRPDGRITLPLIQEIDAAGLTPEQLRDVVTKAATKFVEAPTVTVVVKAIHSRRVFVTGMVGKEGPVQLLAGMRVMQALSMAGGVAEFADKENILILRVDGNKQTTFRFNYKDVSKGKKLDQNIELRPGDTIIVP